MAVRKGEYSVFLLLKVGDHVLLKLENLENRMSKLEEKVEKQTIEAAETKVFLKEIFKRLEELKIDIELLSQEKKKKLEKKDERISKIIERLIWAIVTILGYFIGKGGV